jgi:hypothetical protein
MEVKIVRRRPSKQSAASIPLHPAGPVSLHAPEVEQQIAKTAYTLWEQRGGAHGHDQTDWYRAERLVMGLPEPA